MKKIVIIGANDFQNPLILKAKEMGYESHVFAWQDGSIGEQTADHFYPISITEKEAILRECEKIQPEAVVTIASDLANITVQYLAEHLGLTSNSRDCILKSTNKYQMRCALSEAGVPTPQFAVVSEDSDLEMAIRGFHYPLIVKPTDRSGSRGITKVLDFQELQSAVQRAAEYSFERAAIVEEFIQGDEYSCECISFQGEHHMLAITKKYTTGAPHYIETAHMEPAGLPDWVEKQVQKTVFAGLTALGIEYGASHSEFRVSSDGQIGIIEIGSRMGGDCIGSDLVSLSTGMDFVRMVIDTAAGRKPDLSEQPHSPVAAVRFVFGEKDLSILQRIQEECPDCLHFVSKIQPLDTHPVVDSGTRYGFYIVTGNRVEEVQKLLELNA